jgi:hypothetical protein
LTFTVNTGLSFNTNDFVQLNSVPSGALIIGRVVSYNSNTGALVLTPQTYTGNAGSYNSWSVALTGANGTMGTSGTSGTSGSSGSIGLSALSGSSGTSGTSATSGSSGLAGTNGSSALAGSSGSSRASGANGATGPQGPIGATGPQGPQGARGTSGSSGVNGGTGPQGPTGVQGPRGATGSSPTGPQGATGPQGPANSNNQTLNYGSTATFVNITVGYQIYCDQGFFNNGGVRGHVVNANGLYFYNNSSSQWYSNGAIGAGGGNFFPASTREIKKNIQPFTKSALEIINDTDIVSFEFEITGLEGETHIGFIAEDTREELATNTHDQMVVPSSLGILLKAIQELDKKLQILENNS